MHTSTVVTARPKDLYRTGLNCPLRYDPADCRSLPALSSHHRGLPLIAESRDDRISHATTDIIGALLDVLKFATFDR
jgi:hypothetical protein